MTGLLIYFLIILCILFIDIKEIQNIFHGIWFNIKVIIIQWANLKSMYKNLVLIFLFLRFLKISSGFSLVNDDNSFQWKFLVQLDRAQIVINTIQIHKLACSAIGAHYQSDTTTMAYLSNCIFKTWSKRKKKRKAIITELDAIYEWTPIGSCQCAYEKVTPFNELPYPFLTSSIMFPLF